MDCQWYALRVRPRFEKSIARNLRSKGYDEFLPMYVSRRRWSDRIKKLELPLFPGYLFCRFDLSSRLSVVSTPGVNCIVGFGKQPHPVDETELASVRAVIESGLPCQPWPFLRVGEWVRVEHGALTGLEGLVMDLRKADRLLISVSLLMRSVAVEIDRSSIVPVGHPSAASLQRVPSLGVAG